jgi:hypothetical protein
VDNERRLQSSPTEVLGSLVVGLYVWLVTVFFGAVLLDVVYSSLLPQTTSAFSEVADFLLRIGVVTVLAAIGAIVLSWRSRIPRDLFVASLAVISLEFLVPMFFPQVLRDMQGLALATGIRILISGSASILAFVGFYESCQVRRGSDQRRA